MLPEGNDSVRWEKASIQSREFAYRIQIIEYEGGIFELEGGEYGKDRLFSTNTGHSVKDPENRCWMAGSWTLRRKAVKLELQGGNYSVKH